MKRILFLLLLISGTAYGQYAPTSAKTKFVNGISVGSRDTSQFTAADTIALTIARDSVMYYRYRGFWRPIATGGNLSAYKLISDTLFNNGYTTRARLKQGLDSLAATKVNISDTASMLAPYFRDSDTTGLLNQVVRTFGAQTVFGIKSFGDSMRIGAGLSVLRIQADAGISLSQELNIRKNTNSLSTDFLKIGTSVGSGTLYGSYIKSTSNHLSFTGNDMVLGVTNTSGNNVDAISISSAGVTSINSLSTAGIVTNTSAGVLGTTSIVPIANGGTGSSTQNFVDLTTSQTITGQKTFNVSGNSGNVIINHGSGSGVALNITKGGNGEGLIVNKTSGSGNAATIVGTLEATTLVKNGGTSSQFLKADGSVDGNTYVPTSRTITINGTSQDLSANRTFSVGTVTSVTASSPLASSGGTTPNITIQQASGSQNGFLSSTDWTSFNSRLTQANGDARYLQLTGGTLTGALNGTSASFSGGVNMATSSGNVGIGTSSPNGKLNVSNGGAEGIEFWVQSAAATNLMQSYNRSTSAWNSLEYKALDHIFYGSGSERMRITSGGNVGIGTTSPAAPLTVTSAFEVFRMNGAGTSQIYQAFSNSGGNYFLGVSSSTGGGLLGGQNAYSLCLVTESARDLSFGTSNTERMRITSGGNVLIKTTTDNGTDALQVAGSGRFSSSVTATGFSTTSTSGISINSGDGVIDWSSGLRFRVFISGTGYVTPLTLNNTSGAAQFGSSVKVGGALSFSPSSSKIVSGVTDFAIRNNADNTSMLHFNNSTLAATFAGSVYGVGFKYAHNAVSSNYTLTDNDDYINVTSSCTITLPTAVGRSGKRYVIKCVGSVTATIASTSSQTIDGNAASSYSFGGPNFNILIVYSDGSNWFTEAFTSGS